MGTQNIELLMILYSGKAGSLCLKLEESPYYGRREKGTRQAKELDIEVPKEGPLPYSPSLDLSLSGSFGGPENREDLDLGRVWENGV